MRTDRPTPYLVQVRLSELEKQISAVSGVLDLAKKRRDAWRRLAQHNQELIDSMARVSQEVHRVHLAQQDDDVVAFRGCQVGELQQWVADIRSELREARSSLVAAEKTAVQVDDYDLGADLRHCDDLAAQLAALARQSEPAVTWSQLDELRHGECSGLFADYVDLLAGLTLRDAGLDNQICEIADHLLRALASPQRRLSLPAVSHRYPSAIRSMVKVGFPNWTIWDLPSIAFDVALAKVEQSRFLDDLATSTEIAPDRGATWRRCLIADVCAVYTMGPAYAAVMLMLRLSPEQPPGDADQPSGAERAYVLRYALATPGGDLAAVARTLGGYWDELTGIPDAGPENHLELRRLVDTVVTILKTRPSFLPFTADRWEKVSTDLVKRIKDSLVPETASTDADQRHRTGPTVLVEMLNAYWRLRLDDLPADQLETQFRREWYPICGVATRPEPGDVQDPYPSE